MSEPLNSALIEDAAYEQDARHHRAVLNALVDMGADMARLVHQRAIALAEAGPDAGGAAGPEMAALAAAFDRITRCVRRSVALVRRLAEPLRVSDPAQARVAARQRVIRSVEDTIHRDAADDEMEALHAEFIERLDSPDLDDDLACRPVAEIIADIVRDLGLAAMPGTDPWKRRMPVDLAVLRARAAAGPGAAAAVAGVGALTEPSGRGAPVGPGGRGWRDAVARCRDP